MACSLRWWQSRLLKRAVFFKWPLAASACRISSVKQTGCDSNKTEKFECVRKLRERLNNGPSFSDFVKPSVSVNPNPIAECTLPSKHTTNARLRLPAWLKTEIPHGKQISKMASGLRKLKLHTVCEEARCPNRGDCWKGGEDSVPTATIMIMGDTCTRGCRFCSVKTSPSPPPLDPKEPENTADAVSEWGVEYIVITSVDRDDLPDGGASHFAETVKQIKKKSSSVIIECLLPDFRGNISSITQMVDSGLDVYAHNIETVESLQRAVRDHRAGYRQSLAVLEHAKKYDLQRPTSKGAGHLVTKSSIMLGLGETDEEVHRALSDLRLAGVDCVTLGQYIQPTRRHLKVREYVHPNKFAYWAEVGKSLGFLYVASGPLVRSSYRAGEYYIKHIISGKQRKRA